MFHNNHGREQKLLRRPYTYTENNCSKPGMSEMLFLPFTVISIPGRRIALSASVFLFNVLLPLVKGQEFLSPSMEEKVNKILLNWNCFF